MVSSRAATAVLLSGLIIAGCGSGAKPDRRTSDSSRAAAICRRLDIEIGALPTPIFTDALDKAAGDYDVAARVIRGLGARFRRLAARMAAVGAVAQDMSLAAHDIAPGVYPRENRRMRVAQRALRREARATAPACVPVGQEASLLRLRVGPEPPVASSPS